MKIERHTLGMAKGIHAGHALRVLTDRREHHVAQLWQSGGRKPDRNAGAEIKQGTSQCRVAGIDFGNGIDCIPD
ncbi:MAG: Uncharacterised protein [Hyphomonas sp. TMED17]|nr:MAG: Uncharacterised protein [Hyphomonas sp. TMED17]